MHSDVISEVLIRGLAFSISDPSSVVSVVEEGPLAHSPLTCSPGSTPVSGSGAGFTSLLSAMEAKFIVKLDSKKENSSQLVASKQNMH